VCSTIPRTSDYVPPYIRGVARGLLQHFSPKPYGRWRSEAILLTALLPASQGCETGGGVCETVQRIFAIWSGRIRPSSRKQWSVRVSIRALALRSEVQVYNQREVGNSLPLFTLSFKSILFRQIFSHISSSVNIYLPHTMSSTTNGSEADTALTKSSTHGAPSSPTSPSVSPVTQYLGPNMRSPTLKPTLTLEPILDSRTLGPAGLAAFSKASLGDKHEDKDKAPDVHLCETCDSLVSGSHLKDLNDRHYIPIGKSQASRRRPRTSQAESFDSFPPPSNTTNTRKAVK
jgi:hypothetical protein